MCKQTRRSQNPDEDLAASLLGRHSVVNIRRTCSYVSPAFNPPPLPRLFIAPRCQNVRSPVSTSGGDENPAALTVRQPRRSARPLICCFSGGSARLPLLLLLLDG